MASAVAEGPNKSQVVRDYLKANKGAMPKDIVAGVKKESGIDVSLALVNKVKYAKKAGRKSKTKGRKPKGRKAKAKGTERGAKAQAIRDTFAKLGKKAKPSQVIADLKTQGIKASYSQVSTIRKKVFKRGRKPGSKTVASAASMSSESISMDHLIEAKKLAEKLGGIDAARHALSALSKLQ